MKLFSYLNENFDKLLSEKKFVKVVYEKILELINDSPELAEFFSNPRFENLIEYMQKN